MQANCSQINQSVTGQGLAAVAYAKKHKLEQPIEKEKGLNIGTIIAVVLSVVALTTASVLFGTATVTFPVALLIGGGALFAIWLVKGVVDGVREELQNQ